MKLTREAKEDFEIWFYQTYKHNYTFYQQNENSKILRMIIIDWFNFIGASEIGGHSISDLIYIHLKQNENIFRAINLAIEEANKNYNEIH